MADTSVKSRASTSRLTWVLTFVILIAIGVGVYWWYVTNGPGRTVDTSSIHSGMKIIEVQRLLGDEDETVLNGDEAALRYGRTHIWFKGQPGRGGVVTEITNGPR